MDFLNDTLLDVAFRSPEMIDCIYFFSCCMYVIFADAVILGFMSQWHMFLFWYVAVEHGYPGSILGVL